VQEVSSVLGEIHDDGIHCHWHKRELGEDQKNAGSLQHHRGRSLSFAGIDGSLIRLLFFCGVMVFFSSMSRQVQVTAPPPPKVGEGPLRGVWFGETTLADFEPWLFFILIMKCA